MMIHMLTTMDNPYCPFTQFDDWYAFDEQAGYHTSEYLARIARTSDELSPYDQAVEVERAIDEIITYNLTGNYKKVSKSIDEVEKLKALDKVKTKLFHMNRKNF